MTFRERCSCGAEFEVDGIEQWTSGGMDSAMNAQTHCPAVLDEWRERHEKVCPNGEQVKMWRMRAAYAAYDASFINTVPTS